MDKTNPADKVDPAVNFAQQQTDLQRRSSELKQREDKFQADQTAAARNNALSFAQGLVTAGKVLPAESDVVVELILALPANDKPISFSQAGSTVTKPARDMMQEFLNALPARVNYDEKSKGKVKGAAVNFAAPQGTQIDPDRADIYARAKEIQLKNPEMSFAAAAKLAGA